MSAAPPRRGDVLRIRDERWAVAESTPYQNTTLITAIGCDRSNRGTRARYLLPFEPFERLPFVGTTQIVSPVRWRRRVRETLARVTPSFLSLQAAADSDISILPYQLEPALSVVAGLAARILIADDVGLGKTIQAGLIVAEVLKRRGDARVLVLCPAALREQWRSELIDRFHLAPVTLDSASLQQSSPDGVNPWSAHPLVLTSTDYIKRPEVVRALEPLVWDLLIVDEAHGIAGPSDRHAAAALLAQRARTVVMLTATPHSGNDEAFGRLASIGDLESAFPLFVFRRRRETVSGSTGRRTRWLMTRLSTAELEMHRALMAYVQRVWRRPANPAAILAMIVLTRRACSSASALARTVERRLALLFTDASEEAQLALPLEMPGSDDAEPGAEIGAPGLDNANAERRALEEIHTLAMRARGAECKLRALRRLLSRSGESAIVFTEYRDTLATLERELTGLGTCQLHGGLTNAERASVIRRFTAGDCRILLATDAASEGLNLQARCRLVVHLEVPWTPTRIEQRVGRVDRIGQSRTVHQIVFVARDTVEESRVADVARRTLRAAAALDVVSSGAPAEAETAAYVIGDGPFPAPSRTHVIDSELVTTDLRQQAEAEAVRLRMARMLAPAGDGSRPPSRRPFATRGRRVPREALLALWLEYADSEGQIVWETLAGVTAEPLARLDDQAPLKGCTGENAHFESSWTFAEDRLARHLHQSHNKLVTSIREAAALGLKRERAVAHGIERRHARMAAQLIQGGLFDRRAEREAATQRDLVHQALARCHARMAALEHLSAASVTIRPAFAWLPW